MSQLDISVKPCAAVRGRRYRIESLLSFYTASETVTCPYKNRRNFNMFTGQELMCQFDFVAISYLVKLKIDNR